MGNTLHAFTVVAALALTSCAGFDRIAFTVGYQDATVGIEVEPRHDSGKNPIGKRKRGAKNPISGK